MYLKMRKILSLGSIFLFALALPFQLGKHFFFSFSYLSGIRVDYLAPTIYITDLLSLPLLLFSLSLLIKQYANITAYIKKNAVLSIVIALLIAANCFFSFSKELWVYAFLRVVQWILIFLFFHTQGKKGAIYTPVVYGIFFGSILELILSFQQLATRHSMQGLWYFLGERSFSISTPSIAKAFFLGKEFLRPYGTFSHPNSLAGFYLLVYTFVLTQKKITNTLFKSIFLLLSSALILISFSRSAIAVFVCINLIYYLRNGISCKICLLSKLSVVLVLFTFILNITGDLNGFQKRTDFFLKSLAIIARVPFSGTGIGSYLIAQHQFPQKFSTFFEQPVHNIFFLAIAQLGVPLSLILFTFLLRKRDVLLKNMHVLLPVLCIVITGSIDHYWLTLIQNQLVFAVLFGILWTRSWYYGLNTCYI
jgi:hypothetical protein